MRFIFSGLSLLFLPLMGYSAEITSLPHDLSPWGMFMAADIVVKAVMIGLVFASVLTWTIWLVKTVELRQSRLTLIHVQQQLNQCSSLEDALPVLLQAGSPFRQFAQSIQEETGQTEYMALPANGIKERVAMAFSSTEAQAGRRLQKGTGLLATIGATAPFVGLLGTVWGIMNSFIGIAQAHTTNLNVVAPGIAEALLATALGLVAAIPAVMIYNFFARAMGEYRGKLGDLVIHIQRLLARNLDLAQTTGHLLPVSSEVS